MKQLLLLSLFSLTFISIKAQTTSMEMDMDIVNVIKASPNRDTLYIKDNELGKQFKSVWDLEPFDKTTGRCPVIVMLPATPTNSKVTSVRKKK